MIQRTVFRRVPPKRRVMRPLEVSSEPIQDHRNPTLTADIEQVLARIDSVVS